MLSASKSHWKQSDEIENEVKKTIESIAKIAEGTQIVSMGGSGTSAAGIRIQALMPYINAFESAQTEQLKMEETLEGRLELLKTSFDEGAGELNEQVKRMGERFGDLFASFKGLEQSFEQSRATVATSGSLIQSLCEMKQQCREAKDLFLIFTDLCGSKGTSTRLDSILASSSSSSLEQQKQTAVLMKRLKSLGEAKIQPEATSTRIIELCCRWEEGILSQFQGAFEENKMSEMRNAASLLFIYNGGHNCVQSFIAQHAFFTEPVNLSLIKTKYSQSDYILNLSDVPCAEKCLIDLYSHIGETSVADWSYLEAVFEDPVSIMNTLIKRIFQEPVQSHIDEILRQAEQHSITAYLRSLFSCYQATVELTDKISSSYHNHLKTVNTAGSSLQDSLLEEKMRSINQFIDSLLTDLFANHLEPNTFLTKEANNTSLLWNIVISDSLVKLKGGKSSSMSKTFSSVFAATSIPFTTTSTSSPSSTPPTTPKGDKTNSNLFNSTIASDLGSRICIFKDRESLQVTDSQPPSLDVMKRLFVIHAESSLRIYALCPTDLRESSLESSIKFFLQSTLEKYIEAALKQVLESNDESIRPFKEASFTSIYNAGKALLAVLEYFQTHLLPLLVSGVSPESYRNCVAYKTDLSARITDKIDRIMRMELEVSLNFVKESCLSKQRKSDYKPRDDDLAELAGGGATPACSSTCKYVARLAQTVLKWLDELNARNFLLEFGTRLHVSLLDHIKNFTINDSGAMILQSDLRQYQAMIDGFGLAAPFLKDHYEMLWELGHLFIVRPENLRSVLQEGHLGRLDPKLLHPYLGLRADFSSSRIDKLFPDMETTFSNLFSKMSL